MTPELRIETAGQSHTTIEAYSQLFISNFGSGRREGQFTGISGRIIRGTIPEHFETLTDNPSRKIIFMLDNNGMNNLIGLTGRQMLENIGYPAKDIGDYLSKGTKFKLLIIPETSVYLANWNNLLRLLAKGYPEWGVKIREVYQDITQRQYSDLITAGGVVSDFRKFLHKELNINELFRGDGTTPNGQKEYITLNRRIDSFPSRTVIDFPIF